MPIHSTRRRGLSSGGNATAAAAAYGQRPLTIAMMIETVGLGGAEMVLLQLAQELRERGHTVHVVVPHGCDGWLVDELKADGFPYHRYEHRRSFDYGLPGRLAALLRRLQVDVVHSHEFVMAVYGAVATKRLRLPHVITWHANQGMTRGLKRRVALRWAFKNSAHAVAVSENTRQDLETVLGVRRGLIEVVHNGIPIRVGNREQTRAALGVTPIETLLLSVGSLMERKGHAVLLQALALLPQYGVDVPWRAMIAGQGAERARLEELIAELNLGDRVQLLGQRTDIPDLQAAADVFVLPSLWEGLPLVVLEAMFAANPVVASDISGIPEAVRHEQDGLLVPPDNAAALADAVARVLRDPAYGAHLGANGQKRAQKKFTIDAMTSAYERMYGCVSPLSPPLATL